MNGDYKKYWEAAGGMAPEHWTFKRIEDLLESPKSITVGVMYPGTHTIGGVPLVRVSEVKDGTITGIPELFISQDVDNEYKRTKLKGDELLLTLVGNPGDCVIVTKEMIGWNVARALAVIRLKDCNLRPWIRYILLSSPAKHLIEARLNTTVQKTLNLRDIKEIAIPIAPEKERERIVNIISNLEKKIALNRQINQTLEAMAQALFKSWFVDFEPVWAKIAALKTGEDPTRAAMRAISGKTDVELDNLQTTAPSAFIKLETTVSLFPDTLVESELGLVPEGWEVKSFGETIKLIGGGTPQRSKSEFWNGNIPWFSIRDVPSNSDVFVVDTEEHITEAGLNGSSARLLPIGTSIITARGTVGKIALVATQMAMNQSCYGLAGGDIPFYNFLRLRKTVDTLQRNTHGAVFDTITTSTFNTFGVVCPKSKLMTSFEEYVQPVFGKIECNVRESRSLATIRDTLLPKLLSGEIDLSKLEKLH